MKRVDHSTSALDLFGAGKHGFQGKEAASQRPGTVVTAEWLNGVQEEIIGVIEDAGLTPSETDQLTTAISTLIANVQPANVITASIASAQNSFNPTGWSTAGIVRLSGGGVANPLNGLTPGTPKLLVNVDASNYILLVHDSGSAVGANYRISSPTGANLYLAPGESMRIVYDSTSQRWRPAGAVGRSVGAGSSDASPITMQSNSITLHSANKVHVTGSGIEIDATAHFEWEAAKSFTRRFPASSGSAVKDAANWSPIAARPGGVTYAGSSGTWALTLNGLIPDGATVTEIKVFYDWTFGATDLEFFYTTNFGASATALETAVALTSGSSQTRTMTVSPAVVLDTETYPYFVWVDVGAGTDLQLYGFEITYTLTRFVP